MHQASSQEILVSEVIKRRNHVSFQSLVTSQNIGVSHEQGDSHVVVACHRRMGSTLRAETQSQDRSHV